jgi:hypothetical protein
MVWFNNRIELIIRVVLPKIKPYYFIKKAQQELV